MRPSNKPRRKACLRVLLADGRLMTLLGREAETLRCLMKVGAMGVTTSEASPYGAGRRTSGYVHTLRNKGLAIVTVMEDTDDGSRIGRYFLDEKVVAAPFDVLPQSQHDAEAEAEATFEPEPEPEPEPDTSA